SLEAAEFADAEAAGVDGFKDGDVAEEGSGRGRFLSVLFLGGEFAQRGVEEGEHLVFAQEAREAFFEFGEDDVFDGGLFDDATTDEKFVEGAEGGEAKGGGGAAEFLAAEETEVAAEMVALEGGPVGRGVAFGLVPGGKFGEGGAVVALGVLGGAAIGGEV